MPRAKLDLERAKVQVILQLDDPAQDYAWKEMEKMKAKNKLQPFLRRIITEALPRPATTKAQTVTRQPTKPNNALPELEYGPPEES